MLVADYKNKTGLERRDRFKYNARLSIRNKNPRLHVIEAGVFL